MAFDVSKDLHWIGHASFYIKANDINIYIDPFRISEVNEKADLILITHAHFDHCSKEDIAKIIKDETHIIVSPNCLTKKDYKNLEIAEPWSKKSFEGIMVEAVPAYNIKEERLKFHPKSNNWVGYILNIDGKRVYHAGDTDFIAEMKNFKGLDISLIPCGGTYTMDIDEAIEAANALDSKYVSPIHYKNLLDRKGSVLAEKKFTSNVKNALILKEIARPSYSF